MVIYQLQLTQPGLAMGEFVTFLDHDGSAFHALSAVIEQQRARARLLYSDEDKIDEQNRPTIL